MKCQQPGCSGTVTDGYCDICGMAAESLVEEGALARCLETSCRARPHRVVADGTRCAAARLHRHHRRRLLRHLRDGGGLDRLDHRWGGR